MTPVAREQRAAFLGRTTLFRAAPPALLGDLARVSGARRLEYGGWLWHAGDAADCFTVITHGLVKSVRPLANGRESILGVFGFLESVGDVAAVQGHSHREGAVACTPWVEVLQVPREPVMNQLHEHPELAQSVMQAIITQTGVLHRKIAILSAGRVDARLAALLVDLAERFGDTLEDGETLIPIPLSRGDLAGIVSTSLESAIRFMSRWQHQGILETRADAFLIHDLPFLVALAHGASRR